MATQSIVSPPIQAIALDDMIVGKEYVLFCWDFRKVLRSGVFKRHYVDERGNLRFTCVVDSSVVESLDECDEQYAEHWGLIPGTLRPSHRTYPKECLSMLNNPHFWRDNPDEVEKAMVLSTSQAQSLTNLSLTA